MTIEPPRGLRANLLASIGASGTGEVTKDMYENPKLGKRTMSAVNVEQTGHKAETVWRQLLFSLCCFNAVIHERKKYGALGFNIPYEFTSSDLEVSCYTISCIIALETFVMIVYVM